MAKAKQYILSEEAGDWIKQLDEETDRGAALVALALVDEMLSQLLQQRFSTGGKVADQLLNGHGPLATLSAKADLAHCLGWIGPGMYADIGKLRKIRNRFAHEPRLLTFSDPQIRDLCRELETIKNLFPLNSGYVSEARKDFSISASTITSHINGYRLQAVASNPGGGIK